MATPEQIEAVARAIQEFDYPERTDPTYYNAMAHVSIAAYEATRPTVATDRELWEAFWDHAEIVDGDTESIRAGVRAVRERLIPALPEWVERVDLSLHEPSFDAEGPITIFHDGSGPTIAAALRDAVGEGEDDE